MPEKTQKQLIQEIHSTSLETRTVLLGVPGTSDGGLVKEVLNNKKEMRDIGKSHGKLKRTVWWLIGMLVGSGVIGASTYGLLSGS